MIHPTSMPEEQVLDNRETADTEAASFAKGSFLEVLGVAARLGLTSFGGPVAHLGYFRAEYVVRRRWLDERSYADLVALCQFLPGPASSQVGIAVGIARAGVPGAVAAWLGFTLPSAIALVLFALGVSALTGSVEAGWLHGLKIVAVAVVAQAVWGMARVLCPDPQRVTLAILAAIVTLSWPTAVGQVLSLAVAGLIGWLILAPANPGTDEHRPFPISRRLGVAAWVIFFAFLFSLPALRQIAPSHPLQVFDSFFRVGSLVFGGGHVVLPLLQAEVVGPGWVTNEQFVAGYGATQAVPGPLFTFSAYLGAVMTAAPNGWTGGMLTLGAIFFAVVLACDRRVTVLGFVAGEFRFSICLGRYQCRCGGFAARGTVQPGLDQRHSLARRLRPGTCRLRDAGLLETSSLAGGCNDSHGRRVAKPNPALLM